MDKYIDADKLKAEIERLYDGEAPKHDQQCDFDDGYFTGIGAISRFIDSLQQEQPAKRGYKDCNGCEYNRLLKDQIGWQFRGCFGGDYKGKPIAEIELCPLKLAVQQEHPQVADASKMEPEVELEKASRNVYESWKGGTMDDFLRDMVELGKALNARKEE